MPRSRRRACRPTNSRLRHRGGQPGRRDGVDDPVASGCLWRSSSLRQLPRLDLPDGTSREARFSSLHLDPSVTPAGMILFCQHLTPKLAWRREWRFGLEAVLSPDGADRNVAITFRTSSLAAARNVLQAAGFACDKRPADRIIVPASAAFGVTLVFAE